MCLLLETIKVKDGKLKNISFHNDRVNRSRYELFGLKNPFLLETCIDIPGEFKNGIVKCRILYDRKIRSITFERYQKKKIRRIKLVEADIFYPYKYANRNIFKQLLSDNHSYDEILITRNGYLTDTSYSNIALRKEGQWFTPEYPLLKGTKRAALVNNGILIENQIHQENLKDFDRIMLINAMLDFNESTSLPISVLEI